MTAHKNDAAASIGVIGLAVMGTGLARNLAAHGATVAVYNREPHRTEEFARQYRDQGFIPTYSYAELADALSSPRVALLMVRAGTAVDDVISELVQVFAPGDIIIDGGNSHYTDTIRREAQLRERGNHFVGLGVSGGEEGALHGPSLMPGGGAAAWERIGPLLRSIAATAAGEPCVAHLGTDGAGHFVKMVHNGIEYADMQLIAEAYELLRRGTGSTPAQIAEIFSRWNTTELNSYLIEITAEVLRQTDARTGLPLVDVIVDEAGGQGNRRVDRADRPGPGGGCPQPRRGHLCPLSL